MTSMTSDELIKDTWEKIKDNLVPNEYKEEEFYFKEAVDRFKKLKNSFKDFDGLKKYVYGYKTISDIATRIERLKKDYKVSDIDSLLEKLRLSDKGNWADFIEKQKKLEGYFVAEKAVNEKDDDPTRIPDEIGEYIDTLDGFIAYCDVNAKGNRTYDNKSHYKDGNKRVIAKAGIRQDPWRSNVLKYIDNDNTKKDVSPGVKRAIDYLLHPTERLDILSNNHIKLIYKYYKGEDLKNEKDFDKDIINLFDGILKNEVQDIGENNRTAVYSSLIYRQKYLWNPNKCKDFDNIKTLLENNKNLILTGAPGTGKTYLAKQLAQALINRDAIDNDSENNIESCENIGFVQFHPSYDYSDFVEGLRPNTNNGFDRRDGVFKEFCSIALKDSDNKYVFIIDEINRGEISKIFGELFFSIDPGYRGMDGKVRTQYANMNIGPNDFDDEIKNGSNGHFFVPENVYIIGTMNDIDRSVESMDFAFRRRFAFYEVKVEDTQDVILQELPEEDKKIAKEKMGNINKCIKNDCNLSDDYCIGAAYFSKVKLYGDSDDKWVKLWKYHLRGTLFEYFRGEPDAEKYIKELEKKYGIKNDTNKGGSNE